MTKTEITSVKSQSDPRVAVREAVDPEKYDEYRKLWDDKDKVIERDNLLFECSCSDCEYEYEDGKSELVFVD